MCGDGPGKIKSSRLYEYGCLPIRLRASSHRPALQGSGPARPNPGGSRGPEGEVLLVNGVLEPKMQIATGQVERWRLVNSSARHLRLSLSGHPFHLIRTNGPTPPAADELRINPGDRLDLAVGPFPGGETVVLEALPYDRCAGEPPHRTLATLYVDRQIVPR